MNRVIAVLLLSICVARGQTPVPPSVPPGYVTDTPYLAFVENFASDTYFAGELSQWGPISWPVRWITEKPDNLTWWAAQPVGATYYYANSNGLNLVLSNQSGAGASPHFYGAGISSMAYTNGGAVGGKSTGFAAASPSYWEWAVYLPQLSSCDVAGASGLWPSISMYTDPALVASGAPNIEFDPFEFYSNEPGQVYMNGTPKNVSGFGTGWHRVGIWIDTHTVQIYVDGVAYYSESTPNGGLNPMYCVIANPPSYNSGWPVNLTLSESYDMDVAYVVCFTAAGPAATPTPMPGPTPCPTYQSAGQNIQWYATSTAINLGKAQLAGDTIQVTIQHNPAQSVASVSDQSSGGHDTYVRTLAPGPSNPTTEVWTATNVSASGWGDNIVINFGASTFGAQISVAELHCPQ